MTNTPFNAKGSFDLGRLNNISLLSNSSISDKILVLQHDATGKYKLTPQNQILPEIQYQNEIVIGSGKSYFHKTTFINTTGSDSYRILKSFTIPIPKNSSNKRKLYLSLNVDLFGQSYYDSTGKIKDSDTDYNYYNFTTGFNIVGTQSNKSSKMLLVDPTQPKIPTCLDGQDEFVFNEGTGSWERVCCSAPSVSGLVSSNNTGSGVSPCNNGLVGDIDCSGMVDMGDIALMMLNLGQQVPNGDPLDLDGSGSIDYGDLALLALNMGQTVESQSVGNYDPAIVAEMLLNFGPCEQFPCQYDLNGDGIIDQLDMDLLLRSMGVNNNIPYTTADLATLLLNYGPCEQFPCIWDLNGDGVVDQKDYALLMSYIGPSNQNDYNPSSVAQLLASYGPCVQCIWDLNGDGLVDETDRAILEKVTNLGTNSEFFDYVSTNSLMLLDFGPCQECPTDLNGDGIVDKKDIAILNRVKNAIEYYNNQVDLHGFMAEILLNYGPCPKCEWDLNNDGYVDKADLALLTSSIGIDSVGSSSISSLLLDWGPCPGCANDINNDGIVDEKDLIALLDTLNGTTTTTDIDTYCKSTTTDPEGNEYDNSLCEACNPSDKYSCTADFRCIMDSSGNYNSLAECESSCVAPTKYICLNIGMPYQSYNCIPMTNGIYTTIEECQSLCVAPEVYYSCTGAPDYICEPSPSGTLTKAQCISSCVAPPITKYSCSGPPSYTCSEDSNGLYESIEQCQSSCKAPLKYRCSGSPDYGCFIDSTGPFFSKLDCVSSCIAPPPMRWTCGSSPTETCMDRKECKESISGEFSTEADCLANCQPEQTFKNTSEIGIKNTYPGWSNNLDVNVADLNYKFTHVPGSFTILVSNNDSPVMFGSENRHQYYEDVLDTKQSQVSTTNQYSNNILVLQPNYSTLDNPIKENKVNIKNYPRVTSSINSNGDLVLTIEAKSLQYSKEAIDWFGKVELFVSIT